MGFLIHRLRKFLEGPSDFLRHRDWGGEGESGLGERRRGSYLKVLQPEAGADLDRPAGAGMLGGIRTVRKDLWIRSAFATINRSSKESPSVTDACSIKIEVSIFTRRNACFG